MARRRHNARELPLYYVPVYVTLLYVYTRAAPYNVHLNVHSFGNGTHMENFAISSAMTSTYTIIYRLKSRVSRCRRCAEICDGIYITILRTSRGTYYYNIRTRAQNRLPSFSRKLMTFPLFSGTGYRFFSYGFLTKTADRIVQYNFLRK